MGQPATQPKSTYAEYLAFEEQALERHEFIDGEIVAMSGGTRRHAAVTMNVGAELRARLRGKPCRPTAAAQRVYVEATDQAFYPDVSVVCGKFTGPEHDPHAIDNPTVIVEVLSKSTRGHDLGGKFDAVRRLPSLVDYVLIDPDQRRVQVRHRVEPGKDIWWFREFTEGVLDLESIGVALPLDEIYADLDDVDG